MIISLVAAKIWYLKNVRFLLGHPVYSSRASWGKMDTFYPCQRANHIAYRLVIQSVCVSFRTSVRNFGTKYLSNEAR